MVEATDPLAHTTTYSYDNRYRLKTVTLPLTTQHGSPVTTYVYDRLGQLTEVESPGPNVSRVTAYAYDHLGRLVLTVLPDPITGYDGATTSATYDDAGRLLSQTDALGNTTEYVYDELGQLISVTGEDPDTQNGSGGPVTTFGYDVACQLISTTDPLLHTTTYQYDNLGRLAKITEPDPDSAGNQLAPWTVYTYDAVGNVLTQTDRLAHTTTYTYDNLYRCIIQTDANSDSTEFTYDLVGNTLTLTDAEENTTTWTYDALNRVKWETDEANHSRSFEYDPMGNPTKTTDRDGRITRYDYDADSQQIAERWRNALDTANARTISYEYDVAGELVSASDPDSDYDYVYDELGRATSITADIFGVSSNAVLTQTYAAGRRSGLATTFGTTADLVNAYIYDNLGRLKRVTQSSPTSGNAVASKRVAFTYDAASQWSTITRYADLDATELVAIGAYTFDDAGRLTSLGYTKGATPLVSHGWSFDAAGNMTQYVNSIDGTADYANDNTGQLTGADYSGSTPDETYVYDDNGNRTNTGYTTGVCNRLTSDGTFTYQYDAEGNRTVRWVAAGANETQPGVGDTDITTYTWDYRNRLTVVTHFATYADYSAGTPAPDQTVAYTYDVFDRLIGRVVTAEGQTTRQTRFIYDGTQILAEFDGTGDGSGVGTGNDPLSASDLSHRYLWNPQAVDQLLADETVSSPSTAGAVVWPLVDHLNTARDLAVYDAGTDVTTIANHRVYSGYGECVSETPSAPVDCVFGFTGRFFDDATGLQYNWQRWYEPTTGKWISRDPAGMSAGDPNLYCYVGNHATELVDPLGLWEMYPGPNPPNVAAPGFPGYPGMPPYREPSPPTYVGSVVHPTWVDIYNDRLKAGKVGWIEWLTHPFTYTLCPPPAVRGRMDYYSDGSRVTRRQVLPGTPSTGDMLNQAAAVFGLAKSAAAYLARQAPGEMTPAERAAADEFFKNPMHGPEPYVEPFDPYAPRFTPGNDGCIPRNPRPGGPIPPFSPN